MNLELHQSGLLDCLGQMWTWVSGESAAVTPSLEADCLAFLYGQNTGYGVLRGPDIALEKLYGQDTSAKPLKG